MSSLSLRLPESLHEKIRELAERDNISINQFIATAVAEKAATLLTVDYLETRARRADTKLLDRLLKRVPGAPPIPGDDLPEWQPNKTYLDSSVKKRHVDVSSSPKSPGPGSRRRAAPGRKSKRPKNPRAARG